MDYANIGLYHVQGFFEDGSGENIGLFDFGLGEEENGTDGYRMGRKHYDDDIMRAALRLMPGFNYNALTENSQDWADFLVNIYQALSVISEPLPKNDKVFSREELLDLAIRSAREEREKKGNESEKTKDESEESNDPMR